MPRVKKPRPAPIIQDRPARWRLLLRRQRRTLLTGGAALVFLSVLGAGAAMVHLFGQGESFRDRLGHASASLGLRVHGVVIEGRTKTPEDMLRASLGIIPGEPILSYSVADARLRVEQIPWVRDAIIRRRLPDTIVVKLTERRPFAVWQLNGKFSLVDRDGQIVTDSEVAKFSSELPLVVGLGAPAAAAALIDALAAQPEIRARVTAMVRVGERRWNLRLNNGTDVLLPEGAEIQALTRLAELQTQHALLDRPLQALDLRLPDRFTYRPLPQRGADPKDMQPQAARRPT